MWLCSNAQWCCVWFSRSSLMWLIWSLADQSSGFGLMQASRSAAGRVTWVLTPRTVNRVAGSLRNQRGGVFSLVVGGRVRSVEAGPQDSGEAPRTCSFGGQAPTISVGRGRPSGMRHRAGVTPLVCYHQFGTTRFNSVNSVQLRSAIGARGSALNPQDRLRPQSGLGCASNEAGMGGHRTVLGRFTVSFI